MSRPETEPTGSGNERGRFSSMVSVLAVMRAMAES